MSNKDKTFQIRCNTDNISFIKDSTFITTSQTSIGVISIICTTAIIGTTVYVAFPILQGLHLSAILVSAIVL